MPNLCGTISRKAVERWRKKAFMGCGLLHILLSSPETHKKMMVQEHIFSYDFLDGHDFESKYSKKGTSRARRCRREWQTANEQRQSRLTTFGALWRRLPDGPHPSHLICRIYVEIHLSTTNPQAQVSLTLFAKTTFMRGTISQKGSKRFMPKKTGTITIS